MVKKAVEIFGVILLYARNYITVKMVKKAVEIFGDKSVIEITLKF